MLIVGFRVSIRAFERGVAEPGEAGERVVDVPLDDDDRDDFVDGTRAGSPSAQQD
jgi:hypothetical protein